MSYRQVVPEADRIQRDHFLCDRCLGRMFSKRLGLSSNRLLGKKLNRRRGDRCYICKNAFEGLDVFLEMMLSESGDVTFETFNVGAILRPSVADRDDLVRSKYRLRGIDSIKTDITRELSRMFARKTKRRHVPARADVTFTVNLKDESCRMDSRPVYLAGRYVKCGRGISQKRRPCADCSGRGCAECDGESVEGLVSGVVFGRMGGTAARFTWVGGEDRNSLVLGRGRPFFVKLCNPRRRHLRSVYTKNGPVRIRGLRTIPGLPPQPTRFSSKVRITVSAASRIGPLGKIRGLASGPITVYDQSGRRTQKAIHSVSYRRLSERTFRLDIDAEGGMPVRRLVSGDEVVPSVSSIIGADCNADKFDFVDVKILQDP